MYVERLRRNFKKVIESHGFDSTGRGCVLKTISGRHIHNITDGSSNINIAKLEAIADEIGADMLDFFKE